LRESRVVKVAAPTRATRKNPSADPKEGAWELNIWTGRHLLNISRNKRIVRQGFHNPTSFLYSAEFWGDFSLAFPVRGPWRKTLPQAKHDFSRLEKQSRGGRRNPGGKTAICYGCRKPVSVKKGKMFSDGFVCHKCLRAASGFDETSHYRSA
jgi:hypothetical protein